MPGNRPNFVNQLLEMWARLQWPQRLTIIFFTVLGLALIGSVVYFMNQVEYQVLYRDLNLEDANAVAAKLNEKKIDYQPQETAQGTIIKVAAPKQEIDKLRLEISGSGLARSGRPGFAIFDKNQFGMTDFTDQVNLQRALEGELERTVSSLSEISQARVHIVLRKDSYFQENKEDAKASVVLTLRKGAELSKSSIAGIKGVVAGAVPGLLTRNVSIVDDDGRLLSKSVESGDEARAEAEAGIRENLEREVSGKVVSTLEPVVGKGKVRANASIELDFNSTELSEVTYNPDQPVILNQHKTEERAGTQSGGSGIPGTQSNQGATAAQASSSIPDRVRQSESTNYEVNRTVRHTIQPKGTVRRLYVAAILDHKTLWSKTVDGKVTSRTEPLSAQEISSYRELVQAAVGYNEERGDVVKVENVAFYNDSKPEESVPPAPWYSRWQTQTYLLPGMKYASFIILFFAVYFIFIRPIRKRVFQAISFATPELSESGEAALSLGGAPLALSEAVEPEQTAIADSGTVASLPAGERNLLEDAISLETATDEQIERELLQEAGSVDMGNRKYSAMKKKLMEKARRDPEMMSQLIRTLLREKA
jgi:flagellar M-ring protein FliF